MNKQETYILIDMPNTLFDSRHRTTEDGCYITGIDSDKPNYNAYLLMKDLYRQGYKIIVTHYTPARLRYKVETFLKHHYYYDYITKLYVNFNTQKVINNSTLKQYLYETVLQDLNLKYVIDNDKSMQSYWQNQAVALLQVPLDTQMTSDT